MHWQQEMELDARHVLKKDDNSVLRVALDLKMSGKRRQGHSKKTWKKQM